MADNLSPTDIRTHKFGTSRRGYEKSEVAEYLARVAGRVADLEAETSIIQDRLAQLGIEDLRDFKAEIDDLSVEIKAVMDAALDAAEGMRTRANADAADLITDAEATAAAARGDAWEAGSALLDHADRTAAAMLSEAREDALFVRAEAEQDAKRLVSEARRQADELIRSSREEGEKIVVVAKSESEAILEGAKQSAEKAQERARALEHRRTELLGELEEAESAIRDLEAAKAIAGPAVGPRVTAGDESTHWPEDDGSIRILPAVGPTEPDDAPATIDAEEMAAEVAKMRLGATTLPQDQADPEPEPAGEPASEPEPQAELEPEPVSEPGPDDEAQSEDEREPEPEPEAEVELDQEADAEPEPEPESEPEDTSTSKVTVVADDPSIDALFAKLREPVATESADPQSDSEQDPQPEVEAEPDAEPEPADVEPLLHAVPDLEVGEGFDRRERRLLPIENQGLRGLKRRIVELQNRVLEELRTTSGDYRLGREFVAESMGDELDGVLMDSYLAGHAAAAESLGKDEPQATGGPNQGAAEDLAVNLHRDVSDVIARADEIGYRRLSSDVSRVFRRWRTDEAERHVRVTARRAFNDGLLAGYKRLGVAEVEYMAAGRPCGRCAADSGVSWQPIDDPPPGIDIAPVGPNCTALVVPKGSGGFDTPPEQ